MTYKLIKSPARHIDSVVVSVKPKELIKAFDCRLFSFGSCFAGYIAAEMKESGFMTMYHPNGGVHFSARSIATWLQRLDSGNLGVDSADIFHTDDGSVVFSTKHTRVSATTSPDNAELIEKATQVDQENLSFMQSADVIVMTIGTSCYLESKKTGKPIVYGLGIPESEYVIRNQSAEEITTDLLESFQILRRLNPGPWTGIVTVSPQRYGWAGIGRDTELKVDDGDDDVNIHNRDGIVFNTMDKCKLRVGVDNFIREFNDPNVVYFPSFEIVLEELRSKEQFDRNIGDFHHVSHATGGYVTNRFLNSYSSDGMKQFINEFNSKIIPLEKQNIMSHTAFCDSFNYLIDFLLEHVPALKAYEYVNKLINVYQAHQMNDPSLEARLLELGSSVLKNP